MSAKSIAKKILDAAIENGGDTWEKIRKSAPVFINAYAQSLISIKAGLEEKEEKERLTEEEAKMLAESAGLLLVMGIANTNHILLVQAQRTIDDALDIVRTAINESLGFALI